MYVWYTNAHFTIVSKTMLDPDNMDRFCNFIIPESSQIVDNSRRIDFKEYLSQVNCRVIGVFGSNDEITQQLSSLTSVSPDLLSFTLLCLIFQIFFHSFYIWCFNCTKFNKIL